MELDAACYAALRGLARRFAARPQEADDLLHDAMLEAVRVGRNDLHEASGRAWLAGVLRRRAAFVARSAVRRRRREAEWQVDAGPGATRPAPAFVAALPRASRATATLILAGLDRAEIAHLLGIGDATLRQRLCALRRAWRAWREAHPQEAHAEDVDMAGHDALPLGRLRRELLLNLRRSGAWAATHDPDGHMLLIGPPRPFP